MSSFVMLASALLAQTAAPAAAPAATTQADRVDVAYAELAKGQAEAAITRIRANRQIESDDPAALINLGTAHARLGRVRDAQVYYSAALASKDRYSLELADGRWMDSRRAARLAMDKLSQGEALALR